jgi:galactose-1-phosphate uridylyltransferase
MSTEKPAPAAPPCGLDCRDAAKIQFADLVAFVRGEKELQNHLPDGHWEIDPRNHDRIVYNSSRACRPRDNCPPRPAVNTPADCIVCCGRTTRAIDLAPLSKGWTFINKNLYPMFFPSDRPAVQPAGENREAFGLHFLQWTSSEHDCDWHNMPVDDLVIVLSRLGVIEERLLTSHITASPPNSDWGDTTAHSGYVAIIKNYGHLVGGSVEHGHQQIAFGNVMPRRQLDHWQFEQEHGEKFSQFLLRENRPELLIHDYGAAMLLVPFFMKRPYEMMLVMRNPGRRYVHELEPDELQAVARGWQDGIRLIRRIMPAIRRETAYNVVVHNGAGAGLYFEFLPYTQETGGYEHLGLYVCQGNPADCAAALRSFLLADSDK